MASVMAIEREVLISCVEETRIELERKILRVAWRVLSFWVDCDEALAGLSSGCVDGNGARYWRLVCWLIGVTEEIKSPCQCRSFVG